MFDALRRFARLSVTQHAPDVKMPIMNIDRSHSCNVESRQITLWRQSIERAVPHQKLRAYMEKRMCDHTHVNHVERQKTQHTFLSHAWYEVLQTFFRGKAMPQERVFRPRVYRSECQLAPHPGVPQPLNSDRQSTRGLCPNTGRLHIWQRGKLSPSR